MKPTKQIEKITSHFSKFEWFDRVDETEYKNEFRIYLKRYPYAYDHMFREYEKNNKVRLITRTLG